MAIYLPSHKPSEREELDMLDTAGEARTNSSATFSYGRPHMDTRVWVGQQKLTFISFVRTLIATWKTYHTQWPTETDGARESRESVQTARLDDDDDAARGKSL